ncbi:MAG: hypothetical protein ACXVJD_01785 [Mucilaginibacter sp.]
MKKKSNDSFNKLLVTALVVCSLLFITACRQTTKFAQLKYTAAQVNHWLNLSKTDNFIFQFYTPEVNDTQKPYQLIAYVIDTAGGYLNASAPDTLAIAKDSLINLKGRAVLGNNYVTKKTILAMLTDSAGVKRDYDYLLFVPKLLASNGHVVYQLSLVKGLLTVTGAAPPVDSNPCPPATLPK